MHVLRIVVSGFCSLANDYELTFLPRAKCLENDYEDEIFRINGIIDYPHTIAFIGKNASGKSTALRLIETAYHILEFGRLEYESNMFSSDKINMVIYYEKDAVAYRFSFTLVKPQPIDEGDDRFALCSFVNQKFAHKAFSGSISKKTFFEDFTEDDLSEFPPVVSDTALVKSTLPQGSEIVFSRCPDSGSDRFAIEYGSKLLSTLSPELQSDILRLLDDSIEVLQPLPDRHDFRFKRKGQEEMVVTSYFLSSVLSGGTKRGLLLFATASRALINGRSFAVDEIEKNVHKDLATSLIHIFNDPSINKKNAVLIFSTHYTEVLDSLRRRDFIFVCQNKNGLLQTKNLYDFDVRSEISKSNLINANAFDTGVNYDSSLSFRKDLVHEISCDRRRND